jgi:o-succinylbenzoate synthase
MRYQIQYKIYHRSLSRAVRFGKVWMDERSGILVRLQDESGAVGFGEVAPLESFGSESTEKSEKLLRSFCGVIRREAISEVMDAEYPCTCYALSCALRQLEPGQKPLDESGPDKWVPTAKLIQNNAFGEIGTPARASRHAGVVKVKIGDGSLDQDEEMRGIIREAITWCRKRGIKIRLDANEQLSYDETVKWLGFLEQDAETIEFLEQPMDRCLLPELAELSHMNTIPIALDESVAILRFQESFSEMGQFLYVIKPSLGDLSVVRKFGIQADRIILSSVFETAIGFSEILELPYRTWIPGLDTQQIFEKDSLAYPAGEAGYYRHQIESKDVWNRLV